MLYIFIIIWENIKIIFNFRKKKKKTNKQYIISVTLTT